MQKNLVPTVTDTEYFNLSRGQQHARGYRNGFPHSKCESLAEHSFRQAMDWRQWRMLLALKVSTLMGHTLPPSLGEVNHGIVEQVVGQSFEELSNVSLQIFQRVKSCTAQMGFETGEQKEV